MFMSIGAIWSFLRSPLGKIALGALILVIVAVSFRVWLAAHDAAIREEVREAYRLEQLEQIEKERREFERRMTEVQEEQRERIEALRAERDALSRQTDRLIADIRSGKFSGSNDQASDVLKEAIRAMQERRNAKPGEVVE